MKKTEEELKQLLNEYIVYCQCNVNNKKESKIVITHRKHFEKWFDFEHYLSCKRIDIDGELEEIIIYNNSHAGDNSPVDYNYELTEEEQMDILNEFPIPDFEVTSAYIVKTNNYTFDFIILNNNISGKYFSGIVTKNKKKTTKK